MADRARDLIFEGEVLRRAKRKIAEYPGSRSAVLPLLHMLQAQAGYVTCGGMREIAELLEITPAELLGTASFYSLFKLEPIGENLVSVCTSLSCQLRDGDKLFENVCKRFDVEDLETTPDNKVTVEEVECLAACGGAPVLQVNYRFFEFVDPDEGAALIDDVLERGLEEVQREKGSVRAPLPPLTPEEIAEAVSQRSAASSEEEAD